MYTFIWHIRSWKTIPSYIVILVDKSSFLRCVWGILYWVCMCTLKHLCTWSRWMSSSSFYLQRLGVIKLGVVTCREMKSVYDLQGVKKDWGAVGLKNGTDRAQSVWLGKHLNHSQAILLNFQNCKIAACSGV